MMDLIDDKDRLTRIFGKWPSFHDAEVLRVVLDRSGSEGPTLEAGLHVFQSTKEVSTSGHFVQINHTLVTMRFTGVVLDQISGFNHQNVIQGLNISSIDPDQHEGRRLAVQMPSL